MKKFLLLLIPFYTFAQTGYDPKPVKTWFKDTVLMTKQLKINSTGGAIIGGYNKNADAILELSSTTRTFLPPRMTAAQRAAISTPTAGGVVFDTDSGKICYYSGAEWRCLTNTGGGGSSTDTTSLSNRINTKIDSIRRSNDTVYARVNGDWRFQFIDSIGGGSDYYTNITEVPYDSAGFLTGTQHFTLEVGADLNTLNVWHGDSGIVKTGSVGFIANDGSGTYLQNAEGTSGDRSFFWPVADAVDTSVLMFDAAGNGHFKTLSTFSTGGTGWGLTGNAGTTVGTNFLGTTDAVNLQIRTNNTRNAQIDNNGKWTFGNYNRRTSIGAGSATSYNQQLDIVDSSNTSFNGILIENRLEGTGAASTMVLACDFSDSASYGALSYKSASYTTIPAWADKFVIQTGGHSLGHQYWADAGDYIWSNAATVQGSVGLTSPVTYNTPQLFIARATGVGGTPVNSTNAGFIGMGTASPVTPVHMKRNWNGRTLFRIDNFTDGTAGDVGVQIIGDTTEAQRVDIALRNPSYTTVSAWADRFVINTISNPINIYSGSRGITLTASQNTANSDLRIDTLGNVGIQTASPSVELHLSKTENSDVQIRATNSSSGNAATARVGIENNNSVYGQFLVYGSGHATSNYQAPNNVALLGIGGALQIGTTGSNAINFWVNSSTNPMTIASDGKIGIGQTSPTAVLHLKAGTATANTAPLKFTSGTNLTTAEAGAMEYNGTNLFFTRTGTTRENVITTSAVNAVSPTSPNRTITVVIDGTTYYIAAKTTND